MFKTFCNCLLKICSLKQHYVVSPMYPFGRFNKLWNQIIHLSKPPTWLYLVKFATLKNLRRWILLLSYWKKPVNRTYMYNLNVGEHYYTHFLDEPNRLNRQALTFEERLAQNRISGRNYHQHSDRPQYNTIGSVERRLELPEPSPRQCY